MSDYAASLTNHPLPGFVPGEDGLVRIDGVALGLVRHLASGACDYAVNKLTNLQEQAAVADEDGKTALAYTALRTREMLEFCEPIHQSTAEGSFFFNAAARDELRRLCHLVLSVPAGHQDPTRTGERLLEAIGPYYEAPEFEPLPEPAAQAA